MKLWIDTGSVAETEEIAAWGVLSGARVGGALADEQVVALCELLDAPVSVAVDGDDPQALVTRAQELTDLHDQVVARLPFSAAGLIAANALSELELLVEIAHVFTASQALLAAEAGASLASTSLSALEEVSIDSGETLQGMIESLHTGETSAQVVAGGIRSPQQVVLAARLGAENAAVPAAVLRRMLEHPLTAAEIARARTR